MNPQNYNTNRNSAKKKQSQKTMNPWICSKSCSSWSTSFLRSSFRLTLRPRKKRYENCTFFSPAATVYVMRFLFPSSAHTHSHWSNFGVNLGAHCTELNEFSENEEKIDQSVPDAGHTAWGDTINYVHNNFHSARLLVSFFSGFGFHLSPSFGGWMAGKWWKIGKSARQRRRGSFPMAILRCFWPFSYADSLRSFSL